jgi:hypothetical protein
MKAQMNSTEPSGRSLSPLLQGAIAGIFGVGLVNCGSNDKEKIVYVETPDPVRVGEAQDKTFTDVEFATFCKERGGVVQMHASCGGVNSCKGVSFSYGKLQEHTCKGMNSCAGMSCVDLPSDSGLSGETILVESPNATAKCSFCHGTGKDTFILPVDAGTASTDEQKAEVTTAFLNRPIEYHISTLAFGVHGINEDGRAYANMPGYHEIYSLAELERLITHIKSMSITIKETGGGHDEGS